MQIQKDFDGWNEQKKVLHQRQDAPPFFYEREIWWCYLGINIGYEQDASPQEKTRPVLVLKKLSENTCLIVPLTSSSSSHPLRPFVGKIEGRKSRAVISQMRVIDSRRLVKKTSRISGKVFSCIRKIVRNMF